MTQASRRHEADPFKKVRGMINGMVKRLAKEGSAEASQKDYCDKETKETTDKKEELGYALDKQNAELDKSKAKSAFLRDQVSTLQKDLAELSKSQTEADAIRREEKGTFTVGMKDLKMGLQGVRSALNALHQQYDQPDTHKKEFHHAKSDHSTTGMAGIFVLLEVVEEDLTKKIANIDEEEKNAVMLYKKLTKDNREATHTKQLSVKYKRKEFKSLNKNLAEENSDLDALSNEMDAVLDYSKNLRKQCEVKPETYADKKAKRDAEIEGLKEALKTLEEQVSLLQIDVPRHSSLRGIVAVPH
jgi:chromosome segregation ATPase